MNLKLLRLAGLLVLAAPEAYALCALPSPVLLPPHGAANVPRNVIIRVFNAASSGVTDVTLFDALGNSVSTTTEFEADGTLTLRPVELLAANATFRVRANADAQSQFTTSDATDLVAPSAPSVSASRFSSSRGTSIQFAFSGATDDVTSAEQLLYGVFVGSDESHLDTSKTVALLFDSSTALAEGACGSNFRFSANPPVGAVAAQAMDWAGNRSAVALANPQPGCGCAGSEGFSLAVLAWLLARKRSPTFVA